MLLSNPKHSKASRPWQPRMGEGQDFNPFVRTTVPAGDDRLMLDEMEADSNESDAGDGDPEPMKTP
jgi:hypothetical protein